MTKRLRWETACAAFLLIAAAAMAAPAQIFKTLASFNGTNGSNPSIPHPSDRRKLLRYNRVRGTGSAGAVFKITQAGILTGLYSFCSQTSSTDGEKTEAGLVQATDGNFYGATSSAGTNNSGTVFKIIPEERLRWGSQDGFRYMATLHCDLVDHFK